MLIIVWFGKLSKLTQQKKATLFAEKINNLERKNKATLVALFNLFKMFGGIILYLYGGGKVLVL